MSCAIWTLNITLPRNGEFRCSYIYESLTAPGSGVYEPVDLTGCSFLMEFRSYPGEPGEPLLRLSQTPTDAGSVITIDDPTAGAFSIYIANGDAIALPFPEDNPGFTMEFAEDLLFTDASGYFRPIAAGTCSVPPGVTEAVDDV